jgi:hypothetical protein
MEHGRLIERWRRFWEPPPQTPISEDDGYGTFGHKQRRRRHERRLQVHEANLPPYWRSYLEILACLIMGAAVIYAFMQAIL